MDVNGSYHSIVAGDDEHDAEDEDGDDDVDIGFSNHVDDVSCFDVFLFFYGGWS